MQTYREASVSKDETVAVTLRDAVVVGSDTATPARLLCIHRHQLMTWSLKALTHLCQPIT